ncbi:hypothetical protein NJLHNGOC_01600 [Novacetimonas cocois]|uniref:Uncharacterized protein n=1 Tax=Novacetimonas cocois TaxID=1747507 RepID=A0A365Z1B7_9PROT|nr:hypothetical protein NJLHNGOC_01600 [Novacetimonas cocois]
MLATALCRPMMTCLPPDGFEIENIPAIRHHAPPSCRAIGKGRGHRDPTPCPDRKGVVAGHQDNYKILLM